MNISTQGLLAVVVFGVFGLAGCRDDASSNLRLKVAGGGPVDSPDGTLLLHGVYEGEIPNGSQLWVVARRDGQFQIDWPPVTIDAGTKSWAQQGIRLQDPCDLHVYLADESASATLAEAGDQRSPVNDSDFPAGARSLYSVTIVHAGDTALANGHGSPTETGAGKPAASLPLSMEDRLVIDFRSHLDDLRLRYQFGIFRNIESRKIQWIEESNAKIQTPNGEANALRLHYEVPTNGSYNGFWLRLNDADWNQFARHNLVLRLRCGATCTRILKLELKTNPGQVTHPVVVRFDDQHLEQMEKEGFADILIPIQDIVYDADISQMHELVLVFENSRIPKEHQSGDLYVRSIRLSPPHE